MESTTVNTTEEATNEKQAVGKYIRTLGRRKRAIAQVRLFEKGSGKIIVNDKPIEEYFGTDELRDAVKAPLVASGNESLDVTVRVSGGGIRGQAEGIQLGIARALVERDPELRTPLKRQGFLSRDARKKERKKPGLKSARRRPQWSKR